MCLLCFFVAGKVGYETKNRNRIVVTAVVNRLYCRGRLQQRTRVVYLARHIRATNYWVDLVFPFQTPLKANLTHFLLSSDQLNVGQPLTVLIFTYLTVDQRLGHAEQQFR